MEADKQIDGQAESHLEVEDSGILPWGLESNVVYGYTALARLFGILPAVAVAGLPIEAFLDRIHPDDRPRVAKSIPHAILTGDPYHEVYSVLGHDGYAEIAAFGRCYRDREGAPSQYAGIAVKVGSRDLDVDPILSHVAGAQTRFRGRKGRDR